MADKSIRGRFVWHELMTPDAGAAHGFYTRVLGWKTQPWEQDPSYTMFASASGPLGGTWPLETGQPRWIAYIGTDDIEATVRDAQELGGRVTKEITDMPNGGQYALLEDPQGAAFGVYASASSHGPQGTPKKGEYSWHELATDDFQAAFDFYSSLFGWEEVGRHEMGAPVGTYFMFGFDGVPLGGIFNRMPEMPPAFWLGYVRVKDVKKMVKKVKSAGGTMVAEPMEVPGGDWIAQFTDTNGAMFAVHALATDVQGAGASGQDEQAQASVTPEEAGAKRHDEAVAAAESGAMPAPSVKAKTKRPPKPTAEGGTEAKPASKKSGKKSATKARKQPAKKAAKSAAKSRSGKFQSRKSKSAKSKTAKSKSAKSKAAKKSSKKTKQARTAKRPTRKVAKAKRAVQRRSAKKVAKKAAKRARRPK